jgi:hypothetical protein
MKFTRFSLIALTASLAVACARPPDTTEKVQAMERIYQIMDLPLPFKSIKPTEAVTPAYTLTELPERGKIFRHNDVGWSFDGHYMYDSESFKASCRRELKIPLTEKELNNRAAKIMVEVSGVAKPPADSEWTKFTRTKSKIGLKFIQQQRHKGFRILGGGYAATYVDYLGSIHVWVKPCFQPKFVPTTVKNEAEAIAMIPPEHKKTARNPTVLWVNERYPSTDSYQLILRYTVPLPGNKEQMVFLDTATKQPIRSVVQEKQTFAKR